MYARTKKAAKGIAAVVVVLGGSLGIGWRPPPADAVVLAVGACTDLTIELEGTVGPLPGSPTSWDLTGDGSCSVIDPDFTAPATVGGTLSGAHDQNTVGCAGGVLSGTFTLDVTTDGYGSMTGNMSAVVSVGGVAPLVTAAVATFAAAGVFVQDPFDTKACLDELAGASSLTWTGALVFEDPVV